MSKRKPVRLGWPRRRQLASLLRRLAFKLEGCSEMAVAVDGMLLEGLSQIHRTVDFRARGVRDDEQLVLELVGGSGANLLFGIVGRKATVELIIYGPGDFRHQAVYRVVRSSFVSYQGWRFEFEKGASQ